MTCLLHPWQTNDAHQLVTEMLKQSTLATIQRCTSTSLQNAQLFSLILFYSAFLDLLQHDCNEIRTINPWLSRQSPYNMEITRNTLFNILICEFVGGIHGMVRCLSGDHDSQFWSRCFRLLRPRNHSKFLTSAIMISKNLNPATKFSHISVILKISRDFHYSQEYLWSSKITQSLEMLYLTSLKPFGFWYLQGLSRFSLHLKFKGYSKF